MCQFYTSLSVFITVILNIVEVTTIASSVSISVSLVSLCFSCSQECGGMMTLTDVYCRINRARGVEVNSFLT